LPHLVVVTFVGYVCGYGCVYVGCTVARLRLRLLRLHGYVWLRCYGCCPGYLRLRGYVYVTLHVAGHVAVGCTLVTFTLPLPFVVAYVAVVTRLRCLVRLLIVDFTFVTFTVVVALICCVCLRCYVCRLLRCYARSTFVHGCGYGYVVDLRLRFGLPPRSPRLRCRLHLRLPHLRLLRSRLCVARTRCAVGCCWLFALPFVTLVTFTRIPGCVCCYLRLRFVRCTLLPHGYVGYVWLVVVVTFRLLLDVTLLRLEDVVTILLCSLLHSC